MMKKLISLTLTLMTVMVMILGAKAIAVSPARNPVAEEVETSIREGEAALKKSVASLPERNGVAAGISTNTSVSAASGEEKDAADSASVTAIGDSVLLGAAKALQDEIDGINVDAKESRQVKSAREIVSGMKKEGALGDTVIIALGTNGPFNIATGQALLDEIGHSRHIYWVLTYGKNLSWQQDVNSTINELAENNSNVRLIDWPAAATANPDWLYGDGIHLNPTGQKGYAEMIREAVE